MVKINDITDRLIRAEYALYKTETTDNRFDRIYDKLTHIEASRLKDKRCAEDQKRDVETLIADTVFKIDNQLKELDLFKKNYESLGQEIEEMNTNLKQYMTEAQIGLNNHMRQTQETLIKMNDKLTKTDDMVMKHKFDIDKLQAVSNQNRDSVKHIINDIGKLKE